jgi:hypothetical protein
MMDVNRAYVSDGDKKGFLSRYFSKFRAFLITVTVGILVGTQIYNPSKRVIEALAGGVLLLILWKNSTFAALMAFLVMYPFPFAISWGTSNEIFIVIIGMVALIRVATGVYKITLDGKIKWPLILMIASYFLSLKNIDPALLRVGITNSITFLSAATLMVLIINFIDDETKLRKLMNILMISAAFVMAFTLLEMIFPGKVLVPNWLYTRHKARLVMKGIRMGGPFHDFELVAEFFTLNAFLMFFMYIRSKRMLFKAMFGTLLLADLFMMFTTVTRGAIFSLVIGVAYLMFLSRKDLNIVRVSIITGALVLILFVMEAVVARYTTSGSLFERIVATTFEKGVVPTNRVGTWFPAFERGMRHPLFGNGPGWDFRGGLTNFFWPHSLYLFYFNITGAFGLGAFIFLMVRVIKASMSGVKASLINSSFPEALMKILHVMVVTFMVDQIKIEYLRNTKYTYFIWLMFGLVIATYNIIQKQKAERESEAARAELVPPDPA